MSERSTTVLPTDRSPRPAAAALVGLGTFPVQLDVTGVIVALPSIERELRFGPAGAAWTMNAFSLAFTVTLIVAGALADRYGRRRVMLAGTAGFLVFSLVGAAASDSMTLYVGRVGQGASAAFQSAGAIALVASAFPAGPARVAAFGVIGFVGGAAMVAGPTLGGLLDATLGWRWIFLANVPFCLVVALATPVFFSEAPLVRDRPVDWLGVALAAPALGLVVDGLLNLRTDIVHAGAALAAGFALGLVFARREARRADATFPADVFGTPSMIIMGVVLLALSVAYWALLFHLPAFLAVISAWDSRVIGLALLCATAPLLVVPPLAGGPTARLGYRKVFVAGLMTLAMGCGLLASAALLGGSSSHAVPVTLLGMAIAGIGAALVHPQLTGAVVSLAPIDRAGVVSASIVVLRQGGFAVGVALLGTALGAGPGAASHVGVFVLAAIAALVGAVAMARSGRKPQ